MMTRLEWVLMLALILVICAWGIIGCADHRPGDFAPDQIKWINRNVK